ncbi:MAG TPA: hypothetical protein VLK78_00585 [Candidatus Angelobacter sp.]|nr:hypothetical protein [Candidatus Angelobacter sp.]
MKSKRVKGKVGRIIAVGAMAAATVYGGFHVNGASAQTNGQNQNGVFHPQHKVDQNTKPYNVLRGNPAPQMTGSNLKWNSLGPGPIMESFHGKKLADSGRVASIAIAETSKGKTLYLGSAGGGVWSSTDNGKAWSPLTDNEASLATGSVAVDPSNPDVVYAGTGEQHFSGDSRYGKGVLKSVNGGKTWTLFGADIFGGQHIGKVAVDPNNSNNVWVAADNGLYLSKNGGHTYDKAFAGDTTQKQVQRVTDVVLDKNSPGVMYVSVGQSGLWKSTDGGKTFNQLGNSGDTKLPNYTASNTMYSASLAVVEGATSDSDTIYSAYSNSPGALMGLYVSHDGGASWSQLSNVPDYFDSNVSYYGAKKTGSGQGWYDNAIAVDPTNPKHIIVGGITLEETTDGGQTWTQLDTFFGNSYVNSTHPDQHTVVFDSKGNAYIGNDGGIFEKTADGQFLDLNTNISTAMFYPNLSVSNGGNLILAGAQDNGTSVFTGTAGAWNQVFGGDGGNAVIDSRNSNVFYAESQLGSVIKSIDGGTSWYYAKPTYIDEADGADQDQIQDQDSDGPELVDLTQQNEGGDGDAGSIDDEDSANVPFVTPYVVHPLDSDPNGFSTVTVGADRVYQTITPDSTKAYGISRSNFKAISQEFTVKVNGATVNDQINTISQSKTDVNVIYAGTTHGQVFATFDGGAHWNAISPFAGDDTNKPDPNGKVFAIAINPSNDKEITVTYGANGYYAPSEGYNNHVFWTNNAGDVNPTWKNLSGKLPVSFVDSAAYVNNSVVIGTELGVYIAKPGSDQWFTLGKGLPNVPVTTIADAGNGKLIVGTYGRGAFSLDLPKDVDSLTK